MARVVVISLLIISALGFAGYKAKKAGYESLAVGLFFIAGLFLTMMLASFMGLIKGA